jgi:DNA-binding sugar fermentation-stimulating protein
MKNIAKGNHRSIILLLVQHPDATSFSPNVKGDPEFVKPLKDVKEKGV